MGSGGFAPRSRSPRDRVCVDDRSSVAVRGRCSTRVRRVRQQSDGNVLPESYHALVRWSQK